MLRQTGLMMFCFFILSITPIASAQQVDNDPIVELDTTQGTITLKLFRNVAPKAVENFMTHCRNGYYNGVIFHRVIKDFMIQGGDPTGTGRAGESIWGEPFEDEVSEFLDFDRPGILAMANAGPGTNMSQFFITTKETPRLHMKHTIFGVVIEGYETVERIENAETGPGDRPVQDQMIISTKILKN